MFYRISTGASNVIENKNLNKAAIMNLLDLNDGFDEHKLIEFCKDSFSDSKMPSAENMDIIDWEQKPNTLFHSLFIQHRFDKEKRAGYLVIEEDEKYIGGSGFYPLENDPNICLVSVRTYVIKSERSKSLNGIHLLPKQIELAKEMNYRTIILTFNEYNLWLKNLIERGNGANKNFLGLYVPDTYKDWKSLDWTINIQYTKQWCLYKHIDESYDDEFKKIMSSIRFD
jgi:hypothetical protein